ncbi:MAG: hypothetical protein JWO82_1202 [Akkermansiaceae bacterium]|nr:hypothetical protein [Akkermansiaceae bacterium]
MNISYWLQHFDRNSRNRPEPDWHAPLHVEPHVLPKLIRSIAQFQLGDGGGPAHLIAWNRRKALAPESRMTELIDRWFREEEEHSRLLGDLLKRLGGREIRSHWSFQLFCGLRKTLGVRFEIDALLLTEIVSHVYYKMLHRHGSDPGLRGTCRLIIRDESGHIAFHRARLTSEGLASGKQHGALWAAAFRLRGVLAGTVLWVNHRETLLAMGASDAEFYRAIWSGMGRFITGLRRELAKPAAMMASHACQVADTSRGCSERLPAESR